MMTKCTGNLRWFIRKPVRRAATADSMIRPPLLDPSPVLQAEFRDMETGESWWKDVPTVREEDGV